MSELPSGWAETEIGSVCELINGRAFKPSDWSQNGLPIVRIQNLNNPEAEFNYCNFEVDERFYIESGELLFAWSGTPGTSFGAHVWRGGPAVLNQHIFRVLFNQEAFERDFFSHAINFKLDELIGKAHGGVGLGHVTKGRFESTRISLPPLAEQRRIVAKLDALDASAKRARADLDRIPTLVARAKRAILENAFRGDLTADWRLNNPQSSFKNEMENLERKRFSAWQHAEQEKPNGARRGRYKEPEYFQPSGMGELPDTWVWLAVDVLASKVVDGVHQKPNYVESGIPFVTVKNLTAGPGLSFEKLNYISVADHRGFCIRAKPEERDILISKDGTLGVVRAVRTTREFSIFVSVALIKPADREMTDYLELALQAPQVQEQMVGVGTGLQHIHLTDLRKDCVPIAPYDEQREIVRRIEAAFAKIDRIAAEAASARALLDRLDQAILAKAFRGELVPQDPSDEPAEKLLEKIKAARAAPPARKTRKKQS